MRRWVAGALAMVMAFVLAGCGSQDPLHKGGDPNGPVVVGSADFSESELLMYIYAGALRSTGANVQTKGRIGAREFYVNAVSSGELAVIPDYTGNLLQYLDPKSQTTEPSAVYAELRGKLRPGLEVLRPSPAEDKDVLAVTQETAASGVRSMQDLGARCGQLVLGAPAEWKSRWTARIEQLYGCRFADIRSLEAGSVTVDALRTNQIQVADLFTTSAAIGTNRLVELDDPKHMYPAQNVVPLVNRGRLNARQVAALDRVSAALTTDELTRLDRRVDADKANPADVAKEFLAQVGM